MTTLEEQLSSEIAALLLDRSALREQVEKLTTYAKHAPPCWLTFETRDLVPSDEGFGMRFRQESDGEPTCTCGLDLLLPSLGREKSAP